MSSMYGALGTRSLERRGQLLLYWLEAEEQFRPEQLAFLHSLELPGLSLPSYCQEEGRSLLCYAPCPHGGTWLTELSLGLEDYKRLFRELLALRQAFLDWGLPLRNLLLQSTYIAYGAGQAHFCYLPAQEPCSQEVGADEPSELLETLERQDWLPSGLASMLAQEDEAFIEALGALLEDFFLRCPEAQTLASEAQQQLLLAVYQSPEALIQIWQELWGEGPMPGPTSSLADAPEPESDSWAQPLAAEAASPDAEGPQPAIEEVPTKRRGLGSWLQQKLFTEGYYLLLLAGLLFLLGSLLFSHLPTTAPNWALLPPALAYLLALGLCLYSLFVPSSPLSGSTQSPLQLRQKHLEERRYYEQLRRRLRQRQDRLGPLARLYRLEDLTPEQLADLSYTDYQPRPASCWLVLEQGVLALGRDAARCLCPLGLREELSLEWILEYQAGVYYLSALNAETPLALNGQYQEPGLPLALPPRCLISYGGLHFFYEQIPIGNA